MPASSDGATPKSGEALALSSDGISAEGRSQRFGNDVITFPRDFLWGTATSPTQIEGHIQNEWSDFVAMDGGNCRVACDSYHRYAEDVEWMQRIGVNSYRVGIEWSRLQAAANAPLNPGELARYVDQLDRLNAAGITPMVVLHHFSNPPWITAGGGWLNRATVAAFVDYATKLVAALRDRVRIWNTFNEPDTYACCGYLIGQFPPAQRGRLIAYRTVIRHMAEAHATVCDVIRSAGSPAGPVEVGISKNWTCFEPYQGWRAWDGLLCRAAHAQFNRFVLDAFLGSGRSQCSTFFGLNYYGRIRFRNGQPLVPMFGFACEKLAELGVTCDDMLERHPAGLETVLSSIHQEFRLPIYLTEHGSASHDEAFRELDLKENLAALHHAMLGGVDVRGFYYWSLLDNFEWQFGYAKKFGLIRVDFNDPGRRRTMKPLGEVYQRICRTGQVDRFCPDRSTMRGFQHRVNTPYKVGISPLE